MGDAIDDVIKHPPVRPPTPPAAPTPPIRVTDERDPALINRGYAYHSQAFVNGTGIWAFVAQASGPPLFFHLDVSGAIRRLGSLIAYPVTGEGWYWTPTGEIMVIDGPRLRRVNPFRQTDEIVLDISAIHPGHDLWQAHSSLDGTVHSATVRQIVDTGSYSHVGTIVQQPDRQLFIDATGDLDESHIDASGRWLIIEQSNDNLIVDLATGAERWISNSDGALAHLDCGDGFAVGENDFAGACVQLDLATLQQQSLFPTGNLGHVSVRGQRCLHTNATWLRLIDLTNGGIAPVTEHGMIVGAGDPYNYQCHANLSPDGSAVAYVSNVAGRMDLYVVRL